MISITVLVTLVASTIVSVWLSRIGGFSFPTLGTIRTLGVEAYWDEKLTNKTEAVDWGTMTLIESRNVTLYLRSISSVKITLNLTTGNWTFWDSSNEIVSGPSNGSPCMNLIWNYDGREVRPGETLEVMITLTVDRSSDFVEFVITNDVEKFGFTINIKPCGYG